MNSSVEQLAFLDDAEPKHAIQRSADSVGLDDWVINDSSFYSYCSPRGGGHELATTIINQLLNLRGGAGIDLAGGRNGLALQELLAADLLTSGLVTNLKDRHEYEVPNLDYEEGDLLQRDTWGKVLKWVQEKAPDHGPSLIMHRPVGPLQHLRPEAYIGATHFLLDILRPGGVLLCQIPLGLVNQHEENKGQAVKSHLEKLQASLWARSDVTQTLVDKNVYFPRPAAIFKSHSTA